MGKILIILLLGVVYSNTNAQNPSSLLLFRKLSVISQPEPDTLKSFFVKKHPPYLHSTKLNHLETTFCNKIIRGNQNLITTPFGGILVGELSHVATIKMSKNGFYWYEVALVCLINPTYALNSKFKFKRHSKTLIVQ